MKSIILVVLFCVASAFGQGDPAVTAARTDVACDPNSAGVEDTTVVVTTRVYPGTHHVDFMLTYTVGQETDTYSIFVCFDIDQIVTAGFASAVHPNKVPPTLDGTLLSCTELVVPKFLTAKKMPGDKVYFRFHTYSGVAAAKVAQIVFYGNGVIEKSMLPPQPVTDPDEFCKTADGVLSPHHSSCSNFFVCVHEKAYSFVCPGETVFNSFLGVCDYLESAGCFMSTTNALVRVQCSDTAGDCPAADADSLPRYSKRLLVDQCSHNDVLPPTPSP